MSIQYFQRLPRPLLPFIGNHEPVKVRDSSVRRRPDDGLSQQRVFLSDYSSMTALLVTAPTGCFFTTGGQNHCAYPEGWPG